jgi:predicted transcriptional regulator YheO
MGDMVFVDKSNVLTTTLIIAEGVHNDHYNVMRLLNKYSNRKILSDFETRKVSRGGRPVTYAILNEEQTTFLITLMNNSDVVVDFKERLIKAFYKMKNTLLQIANNKQNEEWLTCRGAGKDVRNQATTIIDSFIKYAEKQGSQSPSRYFTNISKMENKALFIVTEKYPNLRDVMNKRQLSFIQSADTIASEAIIEGMKKEMYYKDIYKLAKQRVEELSKLIPRTPIPMQVGEVEDGK